jgi:predicted pyridoxine 5'-phosphate oxidase superfamily flavin-nucleotide-binding protein
MFRALCAHYQEALCAHYQEALCAHYQEALCAHYQEALHTQQLVYFVHMMSAGCYQGWSGTGPVPLQLW